MRLAFATRRTGRRNPFAVAGEMLRLTTGRARSGCVTVIVAVRVSASGGTTMVKSPTETVPPRTPMTLLFVFVLVLDPSKSPSTWAGCPSVVTTPDPDWVGASGCVGRLEQPA